MATKNRMGKTIIEGAGGGLLGSFIGLPGLGIMAGVCHANKDKIKEFGKKFDKYYE